MASETTQFPVTQHWLRRARQCDAWASVGNSISKNHRFIEGIYPLYVTRAKGACLWDVDGNCYIDYILGYGTIVLGHPDERITAAVVGEINAGCCVSHSGSQHKLS